MHFHVWCLKPLEDFNLAHGRCKYWNFVVDRWNFYYWLNDTWYTWDHISLLYEFLLYDWTYPKILGIRWDVEYPFDILQKGPPVLWVDQSVKTGACLDMKSPTWLSDDAPVSKFNILVWKNEDGVGVLSSDLIKLEPNSSARSNIILLVSHCLAICRSILVSMAMILLFDMILGISWISLPNNWIVEDVGIILLGISIKLLNEVVTGGKGRLWPVETDETILEVYFVKEDIFVQKCLCDWKFQRSFLSNFKEENVTTPLVPQMLRNYFCQNLTT